MTIGSVHAEYLSVRFQALCVRGTGTGRECNDTFVFLFFSFFFLLLAGLFGGIGIFYRNKEKKKKSCQQGRVEEASYRDGKEFAKPERGSVCAGPSCSTHTHHRPVPSAPCIPMATSAVVASRTGFRGGLSSSISPRMPHLHPGSLSNSLHGDWSLQHHPGPGEPREDAAHPQTTSTGQPGPPGHAPPVCPSAAGLRHRLPFGKANRLLNIKQRFAEEEEAAAG